MALSATVAGLRAQAVDASLFAPTGLKSAIGKLGFVQADPIRAPARAQDLILRHRVKGYRAGDLERRYAGLDIEEDILYAYGFMPRSTWRLLHPRRPAKLSKLETKVLETVRKFGRMHPAELQRHFGRDRVVNAWGGYSKATTHALDHLHYRGLLRIVGRERGIRVYEPADARVDSAPELSPDERLRGLVMTVAGVLSPVRWKMLQKQSQRFAYLGRPRDAIAQLIRRGRLEQTTVDGLDYLSAPSRKLTSTALRVHLLAPFDPVVWDRTRFEQLWGWQYRFEAYTPLKKRIRGYYALPLLWDDQVIGWANARMIEGTLDVGVGFVGGRPRSREFETELEAEIERLREFMRPR